MLSYGNQKQGLTHHLHLLAVLRERDAQHRDGLPVQPVRSRRGLRLWLPLFLSEETERELAIDLDLRLMDACSELWVCGDVISDGMRREMAYAADIGIPIRHVKEEEIYVCN